MSRIVRDQAPPPAKVPLEQQPEETPVSAVDLQRRQDTSDCLGVARCPWCQAPLVVRMGRAGPYWQCLCAESGLEARPCK